MRIVITGANGLVGRALADEYREHDVRALSHRDLDITDAAAVRSTIESLRPDAIFNCAVIGVDDCEEKPELANAVNVDGPANLADAARAVNAAIVHFSTNYVFDGKVSAGTYYTIEDEPHPLNVYGVTKAEGEREVLARNPRAFIVRSSWIFGRGKVSFLATVADRLKRGERVDAINDIWASTTYVVDLARRVREVLDRGHPATYHLVNSGVCSYEDFAREAAGLTGADPSLINSVSDSGRMRAPRPRYTPMRCLESERLGLTPLREWRDALAEFVANS